MLRAISYKHTDDRLILKFVRIIGSNKRKTCTTKEPPEIVIQREFMIEQFIGGTLVGNLLMR